MRYVDWETLATYSGALVMVITITQLTKGIKILDKLPTQIWSYIVSLMVLFSASYFTGRLTVSSAVLIFFNGMIVALSSNGGFELLVKIAPTAFKKNK